MPDGRALLKLGCLGTLGLTGLIVAALLGAAWLQLEGEELVPVELEPTITGAFAMAEIARVSIDVKDAEVSIEPTEPGSPLSVEARYDPRYFAFEQRPAPVDSSIPTAHIRFRRNGGGGWAMHWVRQLLGSERAQIRVLLPPDRPLELHLNTSTGITRAELGGLQIEEFVAELSTGGLAVDFSEPSAPMERFRIDSRQSTIAVRNLGNASPRRVVIDSTMGGGEIDLRGEWLRDADLLLESELAGGTLRLPETADIEGLAGWSTLHESREIPLPTLRFAVESSVSSFQIER